MSKENTQRGGMSTAMVLFIVFLILKLTGTITWSWWWVTAPLWGGLALVLAILIIVGIVVGISKLF